MNGESTYVTSLTYVTSPKRGNFPGSNLCPKVLTWILSIMGVREEIVNYSEKASLKSEI